jgi:hypothetical protein
VTGRHSFQIHDVRDNYARRDGGQARDKVTEALLKFDPIPSFVLRRVQRSISTSQ